MGSEVPLEWLEAALVASGAAAFRRYLATGELLSSNNLRLVFGRDQPVRSYEAFLSIVHPGDRDRVSDLFQRSLHTGEPYVAYYRVLGSDGRVRKIEARGSIEYDDHGVAVSILGLVQDATRRLVDADQAVQELEAKNRYLLQLNRSVGDVAQSPLWREGNLEDIFRLVTEAGAQSLDVDRVGIWLYDPSHSQIDLKDLYEGPSGRHSSGTVLHENSNPAYFAAIATDRVIDIPNAQEDPLTKDFIEGYLTPLGIGALLDAPIRVAGQVAGVLCFEHVGDERRWGPEEIAFATSLAGQVALAIEFTAKRQTEALLTQAQKMESIGILAGGIAHDFNNLLAAIQGSAEILEADLLEGTADPSLATEILEASVRAASLTRQLLAFAKKSVIEPKLIRLHEALVPLAQLLRRIVGNTIEVEVEVRQKAGFIRIDPTQFEQVVVNLAVNAREAMPQGGVLRLELQSMYADDTIQQHYPRLSPGHYCELTVSDTGQGMDRAIVDRIFDPFFTTKSVGKGTGLGLSTVYGIVTQAGGHIFVYSEVGRGTTFRLLFPQLADSSHSSLGPESQLPRAFHGDEILVVDDDPRVRKMVERSLLSLGYQVTVAESGEAALTMLEGEPYSPRLVISDVVMPGLSGPEFAEELSRMRPECPVLFISGYTESAVIRQGLASEQLHFLSKPFAKRQLAEKVSQIMRSKRDSEPSLPAE